MLANESEEQRLPWLAVWRARIRACTGREPNIEKGNLTKVGQRVVK